MVYHKALLVAFGVATITFPAVADDMSSHRADVERKSMHVMPFSMGATKHVFTPTEHGGTQSVLVINDDPKQLLLVRAHLRKEAAAFAAGNFADPASIHGAAMPGIETLEASKGRMSVRYADITNGAKIAFYSTDKNVIAALHQWFAAQVDDHGSHATMNMNN